MTRVWYHGMAHDVQPEIELLAVATQQRWFLSGDFPSSLPLDSRCAAGASTIHVDNSIPATTFGNRMIAFLEVEAEASIAKLDRSKFSVTVRAHFQGYALELCVRVYALQLGFAAEFQRRSGDCVAFCKLYRHASRRFSKIFKSSTVAGLCSVSGACGSGAPAREHESLFPTSSKSLLEYGQRAGDRLLTHMGGGGIGRVWQRSARGAAALCASSARCLHGGSANRSEVQHSSDV